MSDEAATEIRIVVDDLTKRLFPGTVMAHVLVLQDQTTGQVRIYTNAKRIEALPHILDVAKATVQTPAHGKGKRPS